MKQGLVGQGARKDYPEHGNLWDNAYLEARHGLPPKHPADDRQREAYEDAYQTARNYRQPPVYSSKIAAVPFSNTTITHPDFPHLYSEAAMSDGSTTDGKIVGDCPGCKKPIRRHQTRAHDDEFRHLHNNHVRCFGEGKTAAEGPALLEAADVGGKALKGVEDELEKPADEWAYRAESALQMYADYLGRPDAQNPTGRGPDEYKARTWNAYETTKPMQSVEDRNINTPVLPAEPLKTRNINTPTRGLQGREDDLRHSEDDEDDEE